MSGRLLAIIAIPLAAVLPLAAAAQIPLSTARGAPFVVCDHRQGAGVLTNAADGYVVTVGHVAMDIDTRAVADDCRVGFVVDESMMPKVFYAAAVVSAVFDPKTDRDFAVLKLGSKIGGPGEAPSTPVAADEFPAVGDPVSAYGFPSGSSDKMETSSGTIDAFYRGNIAAGAAIEQGFSGGPLLNAAGNVVGIARRLSFEIDPGTGQHVEEVFEFGDVLSLVSWLDEGGVGAHDRYLVHADAARYDGAPFVIRDEIPPCAHVVRTLAQSTVYCLLTGPERLVFPDERSFRSWYPDFSEVRIITPEDLSKYRLIGNMTMRQGSLVKIQTDPRVYVVTDGIGTIRWLQTEERARELFGADWASKVRDVPDAFFADYRLREPVP